MHIKAVYKEALDSITQNVMVTLFWSNVVIEEVSITVTSYNSYYEMEVSACERYFIHFI